MKLSEIFGFKDKETGMASYDDMMKNPEYFARAKRKKGNVIMMSPDEYIDRCVRGFRKHDPYSKLTKNELIKSRDPDLVDKYAGEMLRGAKFPTLTLNYSMGFSQEGLHRALAAKKLGLKEVPVYVVGMTPKKERGKLKATY